MEPKKGYNAKKYREGWDQIDWGHLRGLRKTPATFRECEFCGCLTNAKLRRCCDRGYQADLNAPKREKAQDKLVTDNREEIATPKIKTFEDYMSGKPISKEEAYEGLGDPKTWDAFREKLMKEFEQKPEKPPI